MWSPNKTNDYKFHDRTIREQFHVGGTGAMIHKYIGPEDGQTTINPNGNILDDPTRPNYQNDGLINETSIQDLLLLENRDRKYDKNVYEMRGVYNVSDNDFDLTQFGLFLTNDVLYMTFHTNEMVEILGRKLMNGDVLELPHLIEEHALDADSPPIPKFYVVEDGNRGGEGFSSTWWSHIWRVKLAPITDSQEFDDVLGDAADDGSMANLFSTYPGEINIRDAVVDAAEIHDPIGGGNQLVDHLFNYIDEQGFEWDPGETITTGDTFPSNPNQGDFYIRSDFEPNRLFTYRESAWIRLYDNINGNTWSDRTFNASTFVNNLDAEELFDEKFEATEISDSRQSASEAILARPDYTIDNTLGNNFIGDTDNFIDITASLERAIATWTAGFGA